ncbi:hypothetical protein ACFVP0_27750 [Streptomyces cinereoruber]|uniref:hypothetical protein n=1 Tax=Streptomyces cinereoruber TaxID=67260 RepID=UPI0036902309
MVRSLLGGLPARSSQPAPAAALAGLIREAADLLDGIQEQLESRAGYAVDQLTRIAEGRDQYRHGATDGVLQLAGLQVEMLAARRGDAVRHLTALCTAYQDLVRPAAPAAAPSPSRRPVSRR